MMDLLNSLPSWIIQLTVAFFGAYLGVTAKLSKLEAKIEAQDTSIEDAHGRVNNAHERMDRLLERWSDRR